MADDTGFENLPQAAAAERKRRGLSLVWVVPIVAALVGAGIVVQKYLNEGPTIRISFRSAEGIEPGKTFLRYKDVEIGKITKIAFREDYSQIVVTAKMEKHAEGLLVEGSRFWIVKPRVSVSGISGIGTLISGNYIGLEPGQPGRRVRDFVGLETPPPITGGRPGREFVLRAATLGSLGNGSPVYYRRLGAGQVIGYNMAPDGTSVEITIFLDAPYDGYVTSDTRFWESSGLHFSMAGGAPSLRTESLASLLVGGIAFETPPSGRANGPAPAKSVFTLFGDRDTALAPQETEPRRFVLYFREPLQGLRAGAGVTFLGLTIGEVTEIGLEADPATQSIRTRVEVLMQQYRVLGHFGKADAAAAKAMSWPEREQLIQYLVTERGLRAQLRMSSLISGQLYVALDYFPDAPKTRIDWSQTPPMFPVVPAQTTNLEEKLKRVLANLEKVPMEQIGNDLRKTIATLDRTLQGADRALARVDGETLPEAKRTLEELRRAIAAAERLLGNADQSLTGADAPARQELRDALREITRAARAVRELADSLERNPEALLRGKSKETR